MISHYYMLLNLVQVAAWSYLLKC